MQFSSVVSPTPCSHHRLSWLCNELWELEARETQKWCSLPVVPKFRVACAIDSIHSHHYVIPSVSAYCPWLCVIQSVFPQICANFIGWDADRWRPLRSAWCYESPGYPPRRKITVLSLYCWSQVGQHGVLPGSPRIGRNTCLIFGQRFVMLCLLVFKFDGILATLHVINTEMLWNCTQMENLQRVFWGFQKMKKVCTDNWYYAHLMRSQCTLHSNPSFKTLFSNCSWWLCWEGAFYEGFRIFFSVV